ncbi:hypothetical protein [Chitinophaga sp. 212800010-3]|uniref:hypothetical protein n=1 Tax=unclassified Chitinophaga TaxID=2619133 RepID=UPI002DEDDCAC|nr:DUF4935 domain-containing protein [Chitinophaga sp. 212800010-3]
MNRIAIFDCFSEKGETVLPNQNSINEYRQHGIQPIVFLDSCICLYIIKIVDYGRSAKNVDFAKIIALKEYVENHPDVSISPLFGFIELCSRESSFDQDKFQDFKYRMDFFLKIPLKEFKRFKYDFHRDCLILTKVPHVSKSQLNAFQSILKTTYCALLKIRSLASKGVSKNNAENNIIQFCDWMIYDLDVARALEYKLALNIFGGNTIFWKMIGLDSNQSDARKKILSTCWDFFHSRYTTRCFEISRILQDNIHPYFLTSDTNLSNILKNFSLTIQKDGGEDFRSSSILNSDSEFPHFEESFLDKQSKKIFDHFVNRYNKERFFDEIKVDLLIKELELENGIL